MADKNYFSDGDTVVLGKSDKDEGDKRFDRAQSWAERNNPGVNVEERIMPAFGGEGMGGTEMRDLIASGNEISFISKLPDHLSDKEKQMAWNIVSTPVNENLDNIIDQTISEMSSMAMGAIEVPATKPAKKRNVYNPWQRRSSKKPSIKKSKRQRRR